MPFVEIPKPPTVCVVKLDEGQYTPVPDSELHLIGPGELELTYHRNGVITGQVKSGRYLSKLEVVQRGLTRVGW